MEEEIFIPITWEVSAASDKDFYVYPVFKNLGLYLNTQYNLKLQLKNITLSVTDLLLPSFPKVISVQIERFRDLRKSHMKGRLVFYDRKCNRVIVDKKLNHIFEKGDKICGFEVQMSKRMDRPHLNTFLSVHGHISVSNPEATNKTSRMTAETKRSLSKLSCDLGNLLGGEDFFSDVSLECGEVVLRAHKNILSARSPMFKAMFQSDMKESATGIVKINDLSPSSLQDLLKYIYGGQLVVNDYTTACELLNASDLHGLEGLKKMCVDYLKASISKELAVDMLDVAVLHDKDLEDYVVAYISENFMEIEKSKPWMCLKVQRPQFAMQILTRMVKFGK